MTPDDDLDPPPLGALVLFGVVAALGGIVGGFVASLTPLGEAGFALGVVLAPLVTMWSARHQGTNWVGAAIVLVLALLTYGFIAVAFGVTTIPDATPQ